MSELNKYRRPWRVEQSPKRKERGGYNYFIRSAENYYITERVSGRGLAQHIVDAVNEREQLRAALAAATQREPACATCRHARGSDRMWCARPENRTANGLAATTTEFGGCELHQPREGVRP